VVNRPKSAVETQRRFHPTIANDYTGVSQLSAGALLLGIVAAGKIAKAVRIMRFSKIIVVAGVIVFTWVCLSAAAPIQKIQGVIVELEEGFLWLKPDDRSAPRKFILGWKARFNPPKLPLKGDHVQILYKDKEEGAVIYGLNYLKTAP
jgi:hypothetical protein